MESVVAMNAASRQAPEPKAFQAPLSFLGTGSVASVVSVRGKGELHHHLENLGFVPGAKVRVVSEQGGNLIVEIKGSQIALDRKAANRVITA